MVKVCIVILNWNGWKDTLECLDSIGDVSQKNCEITTIVVDNASTNESVSQITEYITKHRNIVLIQNNDNLGFAGGNNVGIREAISNGADYVLVLNNDTILDKDMVANLTAFIEKNSQVAAVSPKIYFAKGFEFHKTRYTNAQKGKVIWYAGGVIDWKNVYGSNFGVDLVDEGQFENATETEFCTGACVLYRTSVLSKIGLFDEKYFLYLEDTDLSLRLRNAGYKLYMVANAKLWHKVSQSSAIGSQLNDYFITRNRLLFASKYANLRANIALFRESLRFITSGRKWQKTGAIDYYLRRFGKGSWN